MPSRSLFLIVFSVCVAAGVARAQGPAFPLVNIHEIDPSIAIELRYGGTNNIAHQALYPPGFQALTRPEVAQSLVDAQKILLRYNYSLKIWDAYRPISAQHALWAASRNNTYVADPDAGAGSLHTWGLAVDATLVDKKHRPVSMPTDFDDFTPAAIWKYTGPDPTIRLHLRFLQICMGRNGFYGLRSEWWHFTSQRWRQLLPPEEAAKAIRALRANPEKKL
jgi:D-alanyl-D-alanine dipeptidase